MLCVIFDEFRSRFFGGFLTTENSRLNISQKFRKFCEGYAIIRESLFAKVSSLFAYFLREK